MLAFFIFAVLRIVGETADASKIIWVDVSPELDHNQNGVDCCSMVMTDLAVFNMSKFAGEWYIWRNGSEVDGTRNCELEKFTVENDNLMSSEISFYTEPNCRKYVVEKTCYKQFDPSKPGKFKSRKDVSDPSKEGVFQIFETDYDSYAVVYRDCWIDNDDCSSVAVILVRHRTDQPQDIINIEPVDALIIQSLDPILFKKNHCHACSLN